jgi:NAD(P)-dependent dehydrogenase (short-subunit alcohol dehydrogenase family)
MRILVVGASGVIGRAVTQALAPAHEVIEASATRSTLRVDLADPASIRAMYRAAGRLDAVVCAAGRSRPGPIGALTDEDLAFSYANKLGGQVNLVRFGLPVLAAGGSFTLTSGMLARHPTPGTAAIALANGAIDAFVRAAALDLPPGLRINCVSPPWVTETLLARGMDPAGGMPAADVARWYVASVEGTDSGRVFSAAD